MIALLIAAAELFVLPPSVNTQAARLERGFVVSWVNSDRCTDLRGGLAVPAQRTSDGVKLPPAQDEEAAIQVHGYLATVPAGEGNSTWTLEIPLKEPSFGEGWLILFVHEGFNDLCPKEWEPDILNTIAGSWDAVLHLFRSRERTTLTFRPRVPKEWARVAAAAIRAHRKEDVLWLVLMPVEPTDVKGAP